MFLGELLVYRYQLITKEQRAEALARQRGGNHGRRLGEILVDMGLISATQLQDALEFQRRDRDPWWDATRLRSGE